jgi:nucleotide-binding universal stress UspA family protein
LFRLGGTSERVAHVTRLPTVVIRDERPFVEWVKQGRPLSVVLGVDETQTSDAAILWTKQLLARAEVKLTVAHVYYVTEAVRRYGIHRKIARTEEDSELETLIERDLAQRFGAEVPGARATFCAKLGLGRLGDHLLSVADSAAADLIVVGTHQGRGLSRLRSVSSVVLHYGHASVACIPQTEHAKLDRIVQFKRVLVPTDLSTEGNYAALHGYSLCGEGGDVHLMHVAPEAVLHSRSDSELARELRALVPQESARVLTRTIVLRRRDVARAICETADRLGVDAICLAASTKAQLDKTLLGSVASEVARRAAQPVMLVRAPAP